MTRGVAPAAGRLFQESLRRRPFWMLAACALVNRASWSVAGPILRGVMRRYGVRELARLDPPWRDELRARLRPLGFNRTRADRLCDMAAAYVARPPRTAADVLTLPGCGRYAADSWAIFVDGRTDVRPRDGKLTWFMETGRWRNLSPRRSARTCSPAASRKA